MGLSMPTHFIHITDPPLYLNSGESLIGHRFICGGATYGRVLFTDHCACELCAGARDVLIKDCAIEYGWGALGVGILCH